MPQSLANVLLHIIYSTKNRDAFLSDKGIRAEMHAYLGSTCNDCGCSVLTVGGVADHVHILCSLSRTMAIADLLKEVKASSSKWVKTKGRILGRFSWPNGYGAFSVGQTEVERVTTYIRNQDEHHRHKTFQDEYRSFLKDYQIEYDEQYVWD